MGNPKYPYYYPEPETMVTRGLKICLVVTSFLLIIVASLILILSLTIFKPKDPYVSVHPVDLENLDLFSTNSTSVPLDMVITIVNPNYGGFNWENSTGYLKYQDTIIAKVPIETKSIPAHSMTNVTTSAGLMSGKLISDSKFWSDIEDGSLNFTSKATLHGKVHMLKVFKLKATVYISCDISFNISSMSSGSSCISKIKT